MDEATANDVIMAARAHWFGDEPAADEAVEGEGGEDVIGEAGIAEDAPDGEAVADEAADATTAADVHVEEG